MIAKNFINIAHIPSKYDLAEILSKNWNHQASYKNLIKSLLYFHCDDDNFVVDSIDLSHLSYDGFDAVPSYNSCALEFLSTGEFFLKD